MSSIAFLLVTCCKEKTRFEILEQVVANLKEQAPELKPIVTVFDNASTHPGTKELLHDAFDNVYQSEVNVGYWSAIDWWLEQIRFDPPTYTYIIESDVIHYGFNRLWTCATYLDRHPEVGSVRLLEYDVANKHLYNKDAPVEGSIVSAWQSSTNKANNKPIIIIDPPEDGIYATSFLTQLCALNRFDVMLQAFRKLRTARKFTEVDFQKLYFQRYTTTGLLDGGLFHQRLGVDVQNNVAIGSWTSPEELKRMGYFPTRVATITPMDQYTVTKLA